MIEIDGSMGEGGGQVLRSALSLSLLTGKPIHISRIRAGRAKPGLLRQHLTAVEAARAIGGAEVRGASINSTELFFSPGKIEAGEYAFKVGTAGSATLVLQTILLPLLIADKPSKIRIEGGTHNPLAPPFDFLERAFLPLIERMGPRVRATLVRPGFYPAGGGCFDVEISPVEKLTPLTIPDRGAIRRKRGVARVAGLARGIAMRELERLAQMLTWTEGELRPEVIDEKCGPGNVVLIDFESEHVTEVFTSFGERGKSAEDVADALAREVRGYLVSEAAAGKHLADQLMLPMAMASGGQFSTMPLTLHSRTNLDVIRKFWELEVKIEEVGSNSIMVTLRRG